MSEDFLDLVDLDDVLTPDCGYLDLDNNEDNDIGTGIHFKIAHLNIHSIPSKYNDLVELLGVLNDKHILPDILLLCETFLTANNATKYHFDNYDLVSKYREKKKQGGVSILIRSNIRYIERPDISIFEEGKFESVFVEISRGKKCAVVIGEVYRIPGTNENEFIETYSNIITKIRNEKKKIIIGTDQNLDYLKINQHNNTRKFFDLNLSNHLLATILKPTRVTHSSATLIDNIYVDADLHNNIKSYIVTSDISDHYLCLTLINSSGFVTVGGRRVETRYVNDATYRNMNASLLNRDWSALEDMSVDQSSEFLINEISSVLNMYAPIKYKAVNDKYCSHEPWFTQGLKTSSRKCLAMYKKVCRKPRDSPEFLNYKNYRNTFNSLRRKTKFAYYNSLVNEHRENSRKLWKILNKLTGKSSKRKDLPDEMLINGVKHQNKAKISNAFAKHYSEVGENLAKNIEKSGHVANPMLNMRTKVQQNCYFFPTSINEIESIIKHLKSKNSCGYDFISNTMLKRIYPSIIKALLIIFNKSLVNGKFPENMKLAIVKPIYKGKCKYEIVNYRPISLLPVLSKVLEKIVHSRVVKFLDKHKVLYEGQYGFRGNRGTCDAILDLTGNIIENIDKGNFTIAVFLDMSKAFDSINHQTLFKKLEFYGLRGNVLSWFTSYLENRYIKVNYRDVYSDQYIVKYGTPQGSVLGPLIYIILANDLAKTLKFSNCVTYADDTTIFASGNNLRFLYHKINTDLRTLSQWFNSNSLTLNVEKSKFIIFRSKRKKISWNGKLELNGKNIPKVGDIKFLGVVLDEYLNWNLHVKYLSNKIIAGNYSLSMVKNILPSQSKRLLYYSNVQSHLMYAISAWGPMLTLRDKNMFQKLQNKSLKLICNIKNRTQIEPFYKQSKILKFNDLLKWSLLKISYKYVNASLPIRLANMFDLTNHNYMTRNRNNPVVPQHTTSLYNNSFLGKSPTLWLSINGNLRNKTSIKAFNRQFKLCVLKGEGI